MKKQYLVLCLMALGWVNPALADSFTYDFSGPGSDPAANFDQECLTDDLDAEEQQACDARAAVMEAELIAHLISFEGDDAPETLALFRDVVALDSPAVQAIAVRYLSRHDTAPSGFLDQVRTFFFGAEPYLGVTAANVLAKSSGDDETLGKLYNEQRSAGDYAASGERLAEVCQKDARLGVMGSFSKTEQFAPAERLLMYDRFAFDFSDATVNYPVTAFVTDASFDEVTKHFTKVFGKKPYRPLAESSGKLNAVTEQLLELQLDAVNGDQAAIRKIQELGEQLTSLQESISIGSRLQLEAFHAENDVFWVEASQDDVLGPLPRAVSVGEDELLGRVVIRYLNGITTETPPPGDDTPGSDAPDGGADDETNGGEKPSGGKPGNDKPKPDASSGGDSGCAVVPSNPTASGAWALLAVALMGLVRRRRR